MASESKLDPSETIPDLPPESFWVARDDEQDWFDRNAVMQRKMSQKLGFNRNFNSFSHHPEVPSNPKLAIAPVFGLPRAQRQCLLEGKLEGKKPAKWLFRSRSEPGPKAMVQATEPGSPHVSCTGRVGFKRGDGKKIGFSRLFRSLFRVGSRKSRPGGKGTGVVSLRENPNPDGASGPVSTHERFESGN